MRKRKLKLSYALFCIFSSVMFISGPVYLSFYAYKKWKVEKINDPTCNIIRLVQRTTGETLDGSYLAQLVGLSQDRPINLYAFDINKAEQRLLENPLIKKAKIKKLRPNAICVDYVLHQPICMLGDCEDAAIDKDGYVFPFFPFLYGRPSTEIYLGIDQKIKWERLTGKCVSLALNVLELIAYVPFKVKRIDVSKAFASSYGRREIVLLIEEEIKIRYKDGYVVSIFPRYLRLNVKSYFQQLKNYKILREKMERDYQKQVKLKDQGIIYFKPKVIDFRIEQLAFIDKD